jgi:hypothetical protein
VASTCGLAIEKRLVRGGCCPVEGPAPCHGERWLLSPLPKRVSLLMKMELFVVLGFGSTLFWRLPRREVSLNMSWSAACISR